MKMLFFSSDDSEVEQAGRELLAAGIPCEVRPGPCAAGPLPNPSCAELWICDDKDSNRALMRCAELGIGFSKRPIKTPSPDDLDFEIPAATAAAA
jgi:hypothetical protein